MGGSFQQSISVRSARCMRYPARRASGTRQPSRTFSNLLKRFSSGEALRRERRTEKVVPPTSAGANTLQAKRPAGANHRERKRRRPARAGHRKRGVHQLVLLYLVWWVGVPPMCRLPTASRFHPEDVVKYDFVHISSQRVHFSDFHYWRRLWGSLFVPSLMTLKLLVTSLMTLKRNS